MKKYLLFLFLAFIACKNSIEENCFQNEDDKILLFVTHRLDEVKEIVNRQIYMDLGKIISDERV
jgi:energy-coupling factor transporter ATP-binding protein EcfA2